MGDRDLTSGVIDGEIGAFVGSEPQDAEVGPDNVYQRHAGADRSLFS